ncbi:O-acyltransferase [Labrys miyagiensis]|uniref:Probable alginate O-acetylase AlgI n=1 Tax=Labrys miyagiensis TaxID=346912 RepID=A0ABQ6CRH7_9HYPH|nr:MBOAT family O-acyltransferase [Labrys miyagiensis]GLS22324.1 O-acyltransferase [Labrys miyagiensis]
MTFTSTDFLLFSVLFFPVYFLTVHRLRLNNFLLLAANMIFYGWIHPYFVVLLLASTVVDFSLALLIDAEQNQIRRRLLLAASISVNLVFLGYFKYTNFVISSFNDIVDSKFSLLNNIILPAGISFYTFQSMSYTIDVYKGHMRATRSLVDYLGFVSFFPHLVAGPIMRATVLLPQIQRERRFDPAMVEDGARQILWGLAKKILVADNLAVVVQVAFSSPAQYSALSLLIASVFFSFQIYADFSAYSDIAIGTAKIMGIRLIRNFDTPYFAVNIIEFWRRWHISLTTWFRDYVFFPMGGSRVSTRRWLFNIFFVFLISGLWHGANYTFLIWALIHASTYIAVALGHRAGYRMPDGALSNIVSALVTFTFVTLAWVFFRAANVETAVQILGRIADPHLWHFQRSFWHATHADNALAVTLLMVVAEWFTRRWEHPLAIAAWPPLARRTAYVSLLVAIILYGASNEASFIYFQF